MQHFYSLNNCNQQAAWVTIGSFDGVHKGHQVIINNLVHQAHARSEPAVVITFYPHPAVVLGKIRQPFYLSTPDEQAEQLKQLSVDILITLPFNEISSLSAEQFIRLLHTSLNPRQLWIGTDFALGKNRNGDSTLLEKLGNLYGFKLNIVPPLFIDGEKVSSSLIRKLIRNAHVEQAANLLGNYYSVKGEVIHGDHRGSKLGFATANINYWEQRLLPPPGVYATWAIIDKQKLPGVTNIGERPTFTTSEKPDIRIETHILDFQNNLYGKEIKIDFVKFLRPERRFDNKEALIAQVNNDKLEAREVLTHVTTMPSISA